MTLTQDQTELLPVGSPAPAFDLPATGGRQVKLADYKGQNLVIVFYPKDSTPGCTRQLCALRDDLAQFNDVGTAVLASNPGSLESHERFSAKQGYTFPILMDADKSMAQAYHALKETGGIERTVYIITRDGKIGYAKRGLPPDTELLEAIRAFG